MKSQASRYSQMFNGSSFLCNVAHIMPVLGMALTFCRDRVEFDLIHLAAQFDMQGNRLFGLARASVRNPFLGHVPTPLQRNGSESLDGRIRAGLATVGVWTKTRLGASGKPPEARVLRRCTASHSRAFCRSWALIKPARLETALMDRPVMSEMSR